MKHITITFEIAENEAFEGHPLMEAARILHEIAVSLVRIPEETRVLNHPVQDINGNTIGYWNNEPIPEPVPVRNISRRGAEGLYKLEEGTTKRIHEAAKHIQILCGKEGDEHFWTFGIPQAVGSVAEQFGFKVIPDTEANNKAQREGLNR